MSSAIKVRCPGCRNLLRIPADWLDRPIQCKHCSKRFRAQPKGIAATQAPPADAPAKPTPPSAHDRPAARKPDLSFDAPDQTGLNPVGAVAQHLRAKNRGAQRAVMAGIVIVALGLTAG